MEPTTSTPLDHGVLSGIRRHSTGSQQRRWESGIEKTIDQAMAEVEAQKKAESARLAAEYAERVKPVPYTSEQLKAARFIRTATGWERVVRVNAKSVSVETGYSWTDRVALAKVLEVRA